MEPAPTPPLSSDTAPGPVERVDISGSALAVLLAPCTATSTSRYCDGLLLGSVRRVRAIDRYTDAREGAGPSASEAGRAATTATTTRVCVAAPLAFPTTGSFYDARGRVDGARLQALSDALKGSAGAEIVGWFVVRPPLVDEPGATTTTTTASPLLPSMREAAVTRDLQRWRMEQQQQQQNGNPSQPCPVVFCCVAAQREHAGATTTARWRFFFEQQREQQAGPLRAVPCHVGNLGHAAWLRASARSGGGQHHHHHHDVGGDAEGGGSDDEEEEEEEADDDADGAAALAELDGPSLAALRQAAAAAASPAVEGVFEQLLQQLDEALKDWGGWPMGGGGGGGGGGAGGGNNWRLRFGAGSGASSSSSPAGAGQQQQQQPLEEVDAALLAELRRLAVVGGGGA